MKIIIGSDHGGFETKEAIKKELDSQDIEYEDFGCPSPDSVDYPDIAHKVAKEVASKLDERLGILICGTGIGISIAANKIKGIRAALCHDDFTAKMAREHNNANILCMGGRVLDDKTAIKLTKIFLETPFSDEKRHHDRVDKIEPKE